MTLKYPLGSPTDFPFLIHDSEEVGEKTPASQPALRILRICFLFLFLFFPYGITQVPLVVIYTYSSASAFSGVFRELVILVKRIMTFFTLS